MAEKSRKKKWMKLDNAALIYPAARKRNWTALFRVSAELFEDVDEKILYEAEKSTLKRFPGFAVRLKPGMFWYYMEELGGAPAIQKDVANPCVRMDMRENGGFMFRVRYYKRRIAVEIFHVITDGTGGLCFLKTLVAEYLRIRYGDEIPRDHTILDCSAEAPEEELEDSYNKYARNATSSRMEKVAYRVHGTPENRHFMDIVTGRLSTAQVVEKAKEYDASVNEFLSAVLIMSVYRRSQREKSAHQRNKPVKICVPVNLRRFYGSRTMRNFASYVNPGIEPRLGEYELREVVKIVKYQMGLEATEKRLNAKMATNVATGRNKVLRAVPLFLKNPTMKFGFWMNGDRNTSSILSNLGLVKLPEPMKSRVARMDFMLGSLAYNPVTCACLSYNGTTCINFTRNIQEADIEREFFRQLVKMGLHVTVESNRRD